MKAYMVLETVVRVCYPQVYTLLSMTRHTLKMTRNYVFSPRQVNN
jgi:hypothetical protein